MARTIRLTVEYDGTEFSGWQFQRHPCRTVQGELAEAVERMVRHPVALVGASRTDRGVHAAGQAASFETTTAIPASRFVPGLNSVLPADVAVVDAVDGAPGFNARHSAVGKHYRYTILCAPVRSALLRRQAWLVPGPLDATSMAQAAMLLEGEHDFRAFAGSSKQMPETTVRTVHSVAVGVDGLWVTIDVVGRSFLYKMVRTIAGTLFEVGRGRRRADAMQELIRSRDRRRAGPTAPPQGLCLMEVFYEGEALTDAAADVRAASGRRPAVGAVQRGRARLGRGVLGEELRD